MTSLNPEQEHATHQKTPIAVPRLSIRQSERLPIKIGIWIFGYNRLLRWFRWSKALRCRAIAAVHGPSRRMLRRRASTISVLAEKRKWESNAAPIPAGAPERVREVSDLKIALLIPSFQMAKGGAEKVAGRLADTLVSSGCRVHIFCRPPTAAGPPYEVDQRVVIREGLETIDAHLSQLAGDNFDLLIGFGMPGFYARIPQIAGMLNVPFIIQECNNPHLIARSLVGTHACRTEEDGYWLRQAVLSHAVGVRLTVPHYEQSVEPAVQPFVYAFFNALVSAKPINRGRDKKIICVGALKNETKNGLVAVDAFCKFACRHPDWSLHLYGENNYRADTRKIVERHPGVAVVDHGIVDDLDAIYEDAHALVIPSHDEGLPNVVVEALSYGVPCIGFSDCSGVKHLISDRKTGMLLDRSRPCALEEAFETIADTRFHTTLSKNALSFAENNLDAATWATNWLHLIRHAANRLDASGAPRQPAGYSPSHPEAARWRELLGSYLHFPS